MKDPCRSGTLAGTEGRVRIRALVHGSVLYWGTVRELTRAGVMTRCMLIRRNKRRQGSTLRLHDELGRKFTLQRAATKACPGRMLLRFWYVADRADLMELQGMRALFPEGLPQPGAEPDQEPQAEVGSSAWSGCPDPAWASLYDRYRVIADAIHALMRRNFSAISREKLIVAEVLLDRAAAGLQEFLPPPPVPQRALGHLRLVIDNTRRIPS
jgi:hypothetical protein